jgi:hypothetical protein
LLNTESVFALDTQHSTPAMVSGRAAQAQPDKLAQPHAARSSIGSASSSSSRLWAAVLTALSAAKQSYPLPGRQRRRRGGEGGQDRHQCGSASVRRRLAAPDLKTRTPAAD